MVAQNPWHSTLERIVYIVDDDEAVRDSLAWLLKSNGFKNSCHANAERFLQALAAAKPSECACILLDLNLPGISGIDLQIKLKDQGYKIPIAFITGHGEISQAVEALKLGAHDFIQKPIKEDNLCKVVHEMLDKAYLDMQHDEETQTAQSKLKSLTKREKEVLACLADGCTNKETGVRLDISLKTVEAHRSNIMDKLKVNRAASLLKLAITHNQSQ